MEHDLLGKRSPVAAVAFKYLKKAKHRSDILNGLNIMQPAKKKNGDTRKSVAVSRKGFFSRWLPRDLSCIILKHEIGTNLKCVQLAKFYVSTYKALRYRQPPRFWIEQIDAHALIDYEDSKCDWCVLIPLLSQLKGRLLLVKL